MASGPSINYSRFAKQGDLFLGAGVVVILLVMLVPLPTFLLDVMLSLNIYLSILILLTAMFMLNLL